MINKTTSVKHVIAKIVDDLDLQEGNIRISSILSWIGEALEKIGAFPWFEQKVAGKEDEPLLVLSNYQTKLPCGFHQMLQVAYSTSESGPFYAMRKATGSFDSKRTLESDTTSSTSSSTTETAPESALVTLAMQLYDEDYSTALARINNNASQRAILNGLLTTETFTSTTEGLTNYTTDLTYLLQGNYIKTNVSSGYLMMGYLSIPLDKEGYPLVPDYPEFLEALYWYVNMKLLYPEWRAGRLQTEIYYDAKRSWAYYRKQAYGNAMMPASHELESIKNSWVRLVEDYTEHDNFFSTLGQREIIYNHN